MEDVKIIFLSLLIATGVSIASAAGFVYLIQPRYFVKTQTVEKTARATVPATSGFASAASTASVAAQIPLAAAPLAGEAGLDIATRPDKKALLVTFQNLTKVTAIDYEITYRAKGGSKGVKGKIQRSFSEPTISREILLGTCSRDVCTYDLGVTTVNVVVTFTFDDGATKKIEKTYVLE